MNYLEIFEMLYDSLIFRTVILELVIISVSIYFSLLLILILRGCSDN